MKKTFHVKRGDTVLINSGKFKGEVGVIIKMITKKDRVLVEGDGIKPLKKHTKPTAQYTEGGIIDIPRSFHVSNLMVIDPKTGEATRTKTKLVEENGVTRKMRVSVKTGNIIPDNCNYKLNS